MTHRGTFSGADALHFGRGNALLIETAPRRYTLRFEEFSVRNGPDLFVYLTPDKDSIESAINVGVRSRRYTLTGHAKWGRHWNPFELHWIPCIACMFAWRQAGRRLLS